MKSLAMKMVIGLITLTAAGVIGTTMVSANEYCRGENPNCNYVDSDDDGVCDNYEQCKYNAVKKDSDTCSDFEKTNNCDMNNKNNLKARKQQLISSENRRHSMRGCMARNNCVRTSKNKVCQKRFINK